MELRMIFGILGNIASMLLYCVPMLTCLRFIKKKSTEDFSCIPYLVALLNCLLYTWYGLPFVSYGWENLPLVTINGLGTFLELSFILIYFKYTSPAGKKRVAIIVAGVILVFAVIAIITVFALHNHADRKLFIGIISLFASMAMYTSPIVARTVIKTKSVEFMPFYLSLFTFLASGLWLLYGMASREYFVAVCDKITNSQFLVHHKSSLFK
ncbi:hypothetical protein LguiA_031829 [Lonicera macranthoides]